MVFGKRDLLPSDEDVDRNSRGYACVRDLTFIYLFMVYLKVVLCLTLYGVKSKGKFVPVLNSLSTTP
jgi:hypothetical protein